MIRFTLRNVAPIVAVILLVIFPLLNLGTYWVFTIFLFFVYFALASMWNLLAGYTGLVCLGQASFIGIAGYTIGTLLMIGVSPYLCMVLGGVAAAALCALISIPILRMRGIFFAVGTMVVGEALRVFFTNFKPVEGTAIWGGAGIPVRANVPVTTLYYLALIVSVVSIIILKFILNSKFGLGLIAVRDNEASALSCGVNSFRTKLYAFILSSFLTGVAASVFYFFQGHVEPFSAFSINWTMVLLIAVIIGGMGTLEGPILGAAIVVFLQQMLARYAGLSLLIQGIIIVVIVLIIPKGIVGTVKSMLSRKK